MPNSYSLLSIFVIFDPSSVRLYIRPFEPKMNPTTGSLTLVESMVLPAPMSISATEPSMPTLQPPAGVEPLEVRSYVVPLSGVRRALWHGRRVA